MVGCSIAIPKSLERHTPLRRPAGVPSWGQSNTTDGRSFSLDKRNHFGEVKSLTPSERADDGWYAAIKANQFPSSCERQLLVEDDLFDKGLGMTGAVLTQALLFAVRHNMVLLEVPVSNWSTLGHTFPSHTSPRWCRQAPFTHGCFYQPWSHCLPAANFRAPRVAAWGAMMKWPSQASVVKVKLTLVLRTTVFGAASAAKSAAYRFLFRPRGWVRSLGDCITEEHGLQAGTFSTIFLRDSVEKRAELTSRRKSNPPIDLYWNLSVALAMWLGQTKVFLQTSSNSSLLQFVAVANTSDSGLRISYTENQRSDHDEWGGIGQHADTVTLQGAIAAVNAYVASKAAISVGPSQSSWMAHLSLLRQPNVTGLVPDGDDNLLQFAARPDYSGFLCCRCNGHDGGSNIVAHYQAKITLLDLESLLSDDDLRGCHIGSRRQ